MTNKGVPDTLYIPLAARIYSTEMFPEYFRDHVSLRFKHDIPQSIFHGSSEYSMIASVARYYNTDSMERDYVKRNGKSNIIHLGTGLETAYCRLLDLPAHFYDMDLPEVIEIRKRLLPKTNNETLIPGDLFDMAWANDIPNNKPIMILILGVFQYFHEDEVVDVIRKMGKRFPGAELVFDATNTRGLSYVNKYVKKTGNDSATMYFAVDDPAEFTDRCDAELLECRPFFTDARKILRKKTNISTRVSMWYADRYGMVKLLRMKL
ncbi:MAG: class I SAM-dependent methyltransferase [Thermoplasmata archaeon]|nr:class I SAM-dependent methyltransferase [Thermoplasmata archaeon]